METRILKKWLVIVSIILLMGTIPGIYATSTGYKDNFMVKQAKITPLKLNPVVKIADVYTEYDDYLGYLVKYELISYNRTVNWTKDAFGGILGFLSINWTANLTRPILLGRYIYIKATTKQVDTGEEVLNFHKWFIPGVIGYGEIHRWIVPMPIFFNPGDSASQVSLEIAVNLFAFHSKPGEPNSASCVSYLTVNIS